MANGATIDLIRGVSFVVGGHRVRGWASGASLSLTRFAPSYAVNQGIDENFFVRTGNDGGTFTITLQQTSISNGVLSRMHKLDRDTPGGVLFSLLAKDLHGNRAFGLGRILGFADLSFSDTGESKVWNIASCKLDTVLNGNAPTPVIPALPAT